MKAKCLLLGFLLLGLVASGCIERKEKGNTSEQLGNVTPEWPKKVQGGYLDVVEKYAVGMSPQNNPLGSNLLSFRLNYGDRYLVFQKDYQSDHIIRFNISFENSYYFILSPETKFGKSVLLKYDIEEFPGWNLRLTFNETDGQIAVYQTYRILTQNESEIKDIISGYLEKAVAKINISGYTIPEGVMERRPRPYSRFLGRDQITEKDVNDLFDYLLSFNYTNERFTETMYSKTTLGLALESERVEERFIEFKDGSAIEMHAHCYSGLLTGTLTAKEGTYVFSQVYGRNDC